MMIYAIIMFLATLLLGTVSIQIFKGKTALIHDYHQMNVTDKAAYGKDFGKAMALIPCGMAVSGVIALFGEGVVWWAMAVLVIGLAAGIVAIFRVQKKHNGGVFG